MNIEGILRGKGDQVISVTPDVDARGIARTLAQHRIGAVLVRDAHGGVLGIVSERDIVRAMARPSEDAGLLPAESLMTRALLTVTPSMTVEEALGLMTDRRVRHLPVMADGRLAGMVSIGDLVKARMGQVEHEAAELRSYVASAG